MNLMNLRCLAIALALAVTVSARGQNPQPPAGAFIQEVVANELADRVQQRKWMYVIEKREGNQTLIQAQVETKDGPLYRLLAINRQPLDSEQRRQDNARIDGLVRDPAQLSKSKRAYNKDEQRLDDLMRLIPVAFLYEYDGVEGSFVRLKFRPKPGYDPRTYEARVLHSLAGTILVDSQQKRLVKIAGHLINRVEFGYGFLGHLDNGGTVEIGRTQVGPSEWKTTLINIQLSGRLVLFKTISKQHHQTRTEFRMVPPDLSLSSARELLFSPISAGTILSAAPLPVALQSAEESFLSATTSVVRRKGR